MEGSTARPIDSLPKGLIRLRDGRVVPRRSGWAKPGEHLACPFKHDVPPADNLHIGAQTVRCTARSSNTEPRCECLFFVVRAAGVGLYWVDMTSEEANRMTVQCIDPSDVPRHLGIDFPK